MKLTINGSEREVKSADVLALLTELGLKKEQVVVELNREIVKRGAFGNLSLKEGDTLEIVTIVGGG